MKLLSDYYHNASHVITGGKSVLKVKESIQNFSSGNTLKLDKKNDSYSTFDDGLLFRFPADKYQHLTYYCRTSTPNLDTCNVKLFKMEDD